MFRCSFLITVLVLIVENPVYASDNNKVQFILDFLKAQSQPTYPIIWHDCFTIEEKFELVKSSFNPTSFYRQDSLNRRDFGVNSQYYLFILDFACTQSPEGIIQKIDSTLFQQPYRWIIFTEDVAILNSIKAFVDSNIVIPQMIGNNGEYNLKQFYKIEDEIYYEHYGTWSIKSGIVDERKIKVISRRRANLHGKLITSSYVHLNMSSRQHLTDYVDKHIDSIMKVNYLIVNTVLDTLNVTKHELFQMTWGYYNMRTKKWSGMVGDMVHNGADIGGTPLFIQPDRLPYIHYTSLYTPTKGGFVFRSPQLSAVHNIYTLPFKPLVWLSCLISVLLSTVLLHLTSQSEKEKSANASHHKRITDSALSSVAVVCQMDASFRSTVTSSRIIMFFIFLTFSFLYAAYTANIVSLLQSPSKSINTMEELYNSKLELGVHDVPYMRHYLSITNVPFFKQIYEDRLMKPFANHPDHFMPSEEGVSRLRNGMFAFIMEASPMYKIMEDTFYEHEKCGLVSIEFMKFTDPYLAVARDSPYKEIFRVKLVKTLEVGINKRIQSRFYTKKPVCVNRLNFQSIGIDDALPAMMLLPYGMAFAFIILALEKIFSLKRFKNNLCLKI